MKKSLHAATLFGAILLLAALSPSCGSDVKVGPGGFCEKDTQCETGLICKQNICVEPGTGDCDPPCKDDEVCRDGTCVPINPASDQDGDGWSSTDDCDDLDPFTHPADDENGIPGGFEYCDGKDNDCDGVTDEDCRACHDGDTQDCGTDMGECTPGVQTCTAGVYGECSGQGPVAEKPDGLDNDCDGSIDEGLPCETGQTQACGTDIGECSPGQQECLEGKWGLCQGLMPAPEVCDGKDNDCDGLLDDGFMIGQVCDGIGECGAGTFECAMQDSIRCSTEPGGSLDQSAQDICNGLDDDCDGDTDESFNIGATCTGTGLCGNGTIECLNQSTAICSSDPGGSGDQSALDVCDGYDNDCDGLTDEDFGIGTACNGEGACGPGQVECATEDDTRCSSNPGGSQDNSQAESCDGLDNNCDGETDEGNDIDLCSPLPPHVVGAVCNRVGATCEISDPAQDCELGYWDLNGDYDDGCELSDDGAGNICDDAIGLQDVSDFGGGGIETAAGLLVPAGDEDWYQITGVDNLVDDEQVSGCDSYNVQISFINQPEGVVFDVSTDSCTESGCTLSNQFEFLTNFRDAVGIGECPCSMTNEPGKNICDKEDHVFYIRVYRLAGYPVSDEEYEIQITNGI